MSRLLSPVKWTCPKCGHAHEWEWGDLDVWAATAGKTEMHCDLCHAVTPMRLRFEEVDR